MPKAKSTTNMMAFGVKRYIRQSAIINVDAVSDNRIAILGCGANGSFIAMSLAKMGFKHFQLWDFDKVEEHNLPNQFFSEDDLGEKKTVSTYNWIRKMNSEAIVMVSGKYEGEDMGAQIVISCVDKMSVRKQIFESCKRSKKNQLFIDTRMSGLEGQVYSVDLSNKESVETYEKSLFTDEEAVQERCTARSILFTVLGISSIVCNQIVKAIRGEELGNYIVLDYTVPQLM